jgi:hypothetical protein
MTICQNAAIRRRLGHSERGAATLEGIGMYVVADILVAAVARAAVGSGPVIGDRFRQAVCELTSLGQGSCESLVADHKPTEPCVVSADGHTGALEGSVVVAVGGSENLLVEKLDNGKYATAAESADSGPGKHQYSTETVAELPIRSATDQAVARRYLTAAGLGPMAGFNDLPDDVKNSLPIPNLADPKEASEAFVKATGEHGFVTKQTFDDSNSTSYGGVFDAEEIAKFSGGISFDKVGRKSTGPKYWDGSKMVPKTGCGEK